jgi:azurin
MLSIVKKLFILLLIVGGVGVAATEAESDREDVRTIEIEGLDNMRYDVEEIVAEPGEVLRIEFKTVSDMPSAAMQHNIAILDLDTDVDAFVNASMAADDNEYIAPDMEGDVIAATDMLAGGETDVIEFTVPETPGEYEFVCTFPGHYAAGMVGVLIVE